MKPSRSVITLTLLALLTGLPLQGNGETIPTRAEQVRLERQPIADLGNGFYRNPILAGNYGDPSIVKTGSDFYLARSGGSGFMIWHSRDLVNWRLVLQHAFDDLSGIWAVDLQYFDGKFHLFMPVGEWPGKTNEHYRANFVVSAVKPEGPWSAPHRIDREFIPDDYYTGIDPGFVQTPEGKKFLYTDHGYVMPLSDELIATAQPKMVYAGWQYPRDWIVEGFCLESPKLFRKDGWYYLVSAQGGTSGPSTAHMAVVARSQSPVGPWENSPFNPLVHTYSESEKWWQQGHATIFEGPGGGWWTIYHARQNGATSVGRQTLLMPVAWTPDGWPVIKDGARADALLAKPRGENVGHGLPISDDFMATSLGWQWDVPNRDAALIKTGGGVLVMSAREGGTFLRTSANNVSYEAVVEVECPQGVLAGLVFGNGEGLKTDGQKVSYNKGEIWRTRDTDVPVQKRSRVCLKIRCYRQDLSFACSDDGVNWITFQNGVRGGDYSIRLFASGKGAATFRNFKYLGLD